MVLEKDKAAHGLRKLRTVDGLPNWHKLAIGTV